MSSPRCPAHEQAAVATCSRCGTFLCGECTELLGEGAYCASCVALVRAHGSVSRGLQVALGLGVVALLSFPLLRTLPVLNGLAAGLGLGLSARELRRLGSEGPPSRARTFARWTRGVAWVNLGLVLLWVALLGWLLLGGYVVGRS